MRIIRFTCDFCGAIEETEIPSGGQWPRVMWPIGHGEACGSCKDRALCVKRTKKTKANQ